MVFWFFEVFLFGFEGLSWSLLVRSLRNNLVGVFDIRRRRELGS